MRFLLIFWLLVTFTYSCSSLNIKQPQVMNCPSSGICKTEVLENERYILKRDQFSKSYVELQQQEGARQLKILFDQNQDPSIADSPYREEYFLPLTVIENQITAQKSTFKINLLYGRIGNYRGQDLYHVKDDVLVSIKKQDGKTYLNLTLNQPELKLNELTVLLD
ncbi:hypothetical protein [Nonlabens spongiae]|nr:hypothetical protein [Nonlabens spongiae]